MILYVVCHPFILTQEEINFYRQQLMSTPQTPQKIPSNFTLQSQHLSQSLPGEKVNRIGVISGQFYPASSIEKILQDLSNMKLPEIDKDKKIQSKSVVSVTGLVSLAEDKLGKYVNQFSLVSNPLDIHLLLISLPTLTMEIMMTIKFHEGQDISQIVKNFIMLTNIVIELNQSKELLQLHSDLIRKQFLHVIVLGIVLIN
jgi:hypothetical protein